MVVDGNTFYTIEGLFNGTLTTSKPTVCFGKNIGKANATSDNGQAEAEAEARYNKKLETGYALDINDIDTCRTYFEPMLAEKYIDRKNKVKFPVLGSTKIDGMRMVNVKGATTTRNGKNIPSCPHITNALKPLFKAYPKGLVDGEIYADNEYFEDIMSLVKKTKNLTPENLLESEQKAKLWVFDGFLSDPKVGFSTRFEEIKKAILEHVAPEHLKYFVFVENVVLINHEEILKQHEIYVAQGFEGIILRVIDGPYENKRSTYLLKYKDFIDEEFVIVDMLEGTGNDAGLASKLVVRLKDGSTSEAGIRGKDNYTSMLLKNKKKYIGKLATVRYQGFTKEGKLRFGVAINIDPFDR
jgi:DNA ligase-1